jgi:hypothetical protein
MTPGVATVRSEIDQGAVGPSSAGETATGAPLPVQSTALTIVSHSSPAQRTLTTMLSSFSSAARHPPAASFPRRQPTRRFTKEEHEKLNEVFIHCRQNGYTLRPHAERLAEEMGRSLDSIMTQLSPTLRCIHMPRDDWEEVMARPLGRHFPLQRPLLHRGGAQAQGHRASAPTFQSTAAAPRSETEHEESGTECEEGGEASQGQDVTDDGCDKGTPVVEVGGRSDAENSPATAADAGATTEAAAATAHADRAPAPVSYTPPGSAHGEEGEVDNPQAPDAASPPPARDKESINEDPQSECGAENDHADANEGRPEPPTDRSDHDNGLPATDAAHRNASSAPAPSASSSSSLGLSNASSTSSLRAIRVISLTELQSLCAHMALLPPGAGQTALQFLQDSEELDGAFLIRSDGSSSSDGADEAAESVREQGSSAGEESAADSDQGSEERAEQDHETAADRALGKLLNPHHGPPAVEQAVVSALQRQVTARDTGVGGVQQPSAGAPVGPHKRTANDAAGAATDLEPEPKRSRCTTEGPALGARSKPTLMNTTPTPAKRPTTRPSRHGLVYTTEEDETILAAFQHCRRQGESWEAMKEELAAKFARTPCAIESRRGALHAARQWAAKRR